MHSRYHWLLDLGDDKHYVKLESECWSMVEAIEKAIANMQYGPVEMIAGVQAWSTPEMDYDADGEEDDTLYLY